MKVEDNKVVVAAQEAEYSGKMAVLEAREDNADEEEVEHKG